MIFQETSIKFGEIPATASCMWCPSPPRKVYPVLLDLIAAAGRTGHDADLLEHAKECGWDATCNDWGLGIMRFSS